MSIIQTVENSGQQRVLLLGLDGTPYTFLTRMIRTGQMPNVAKLLTEGSLSPMHSVHPPVSAVAWSSFMTGSNPAKHGIFGFIDRDPLTYKTYIPTARHMKSPTLWQLLSQAGRRVVVMNVPVTYPPRAVNGVLVADFLSPTLEKIAYPPATVDTLRSLGYKIDADPHIARESLDLMMAEINDVLERRAKAFFHFLDKERWDIFVGVIMETDRLHHFFWELMEDGHPKYAEAFYRVYRRIDDIIGQIRQRLDDRTTLMLMSDHGFCGVKKSVYVNHWLVEQGWLKFAKQPARDLVDIDASSIAYALDPSRVFIRVRGRERDGTVEPGAEYEQLRQRIIAAALQLRDPDSGDLLFSAAFRREEIYSGPLIDLAADIVLAPANGYDPKGAWAVGSLTEKDKVLIGMHTYDDAMLYLQGHTLPDRNIAITDVLPTILRITDIPIPPEVDGTTLI